MRTLHLTATALLLAASIVAQAERLHTSRPAGQQLIKLPKEDTAFGFVVFGDRTAGPPDGVKILAQAVADTNLLDPDLVMTVGDMVQGYNDTAAWLKQAAEYKGIMGKLRMPWFPVAGNHDIYYRGADKPKGEHETNFETTFGPLWYAFSHKTAWFIVLYSDEGNPETGVKDFTRPDCQRMSKEQFEWLQQTLQKAKAAKHVFVFLHHPRWLARYGDDWDKVHKALVAAGNVTAVFAGHIHRMRFDGVKDGIQYFTLAAIGGSIDLELPQAGYLHEFHVVTVRPEGIQVAMLPVGTVLDPKLITGEVSEDAALLHEKLVPENVKGLAVKADGSAEGVLEFELKNPARRPIELLIEPLANAQWTFQPDHTHAAVAAGGKTTVSFVATRKPGSEFDLPEVDVRCDYLGVGVRFSLPKAVHTLALQAPADLPVDASARGCLKLDGKKACLELATDQLALPDGPFTVEAWCNGADYKGRRALLAKTESSEWAIFVSDGELEFSLHIDGKYARARSKPGVLQAGRWHHVAGVFDGRDIRVHLDGEQLAVDKVRGERTTNRHPMFIGADPDGQGRPGSFFQGLIDEVRITRGARYGADKFTPERRFEANADTLLLLHLDQDFGPWTPDSSARHVHPRRRGGAICVPGDG